MSFLPWLRNSGARLVPLSLRSRPFSMNSTTKVWKLGDGLPGSETAWRTQTDNDPRKVFTIDEMPPMNAYKLLTSVIAPRPIAFVSSLSADGKPNLAPMRQASSTLRNRMTLTEPALVISAWCDPSLSLNDIAHAISRSPQVSHKPALLSVSFSLSPRRPKDSRENILATKEFTVSIISEPFVHAANATAVEAPADVDEWIVSGLTMEPSVRSVICLHADHDQLCTQSIVKPAFVHESAVGIECELYSSQDFADPADPSQITTTMVLGLIKKASLMNEYLLYHFLSFRL